MTLLETIKKKSLELRKEKNKLGLSLTTLINDISMIGKNSIPPRESTEEETVRTIRKTIQILNDNLNLVKDENKIISIKEEIELLETFLPQQLTEENLQKLIVEFIEKNNLDKSNKSIGPIMKFLNSEYLGKFEPKIANQIIKNIL